MSSTNSSSIGPHAIPPRTSSSGQPAQHNTTSPPRASAANTLHTVLEASWLSRTSQSPVDPTAKRKPSLPSSPPSSSSNPRVLRHTSLPTTNLLAAMSSSSSSTHQQPPPPAPPDPSRFAHFDPAPPPPTSDAVITAPFDYLNSQRGKDFRSLLIAAFNRWLHVPPASLEIITKVVGMLHTASLLIDDVEDNSLLRRGLPVAHALFGVPQTINSANYIYFCALHELRKLPRSDAAIAVFTEELLSLHRGQGMDLFWRDTLTCPTEDEYLEMVGNKTGGLFRLGIKLMQAESSDPNAPDCVPLVNLIGLVFQIRDDYQNLQSTEYSDNKGMAEDLTEGKFSFPIIHSIRSNPGNLQLINILKQRTKDEEVKRYAVKYMQGTGTFEYTLKVLDLLIQRARGVAEEIDRARGEERNQGIEMILDKMVIGGKDEMHFPPKP